MNDLKTQLINLANKYETEGFIGSDPIQFPRHFCTDTDYAGQIMRNKRNIEISGFITSWLSYGNRKQIIKTVEKLHILMGWKPYDYLMSQEWQRYKGSKERLYRFNTYGDYSELLERLYTIYKLYSDLENAVINLTDSKINVKYTLHYLNMCGYIQRLQVLFEGVSGIPLLSSGSACKRLAMFLRWMIRRNSPVDMGIWRRCQPESLLIPLDTHVHKQALNLGITKRKSADMRTAKEITDYFNNIFPGDPAKGDFALFGYGVNNG